MLRLFSLFLGVALAVVLAAGCGGEAPAPQEPVAEGLDPDDEVTALLREWGALTHGPAEMLDFGRATILANMIAEHGELGQLMQVLEADEASPVAKLLAVVSLTAFLSTDMVDPLLAMTASEHEGTTRAGATKLLGTMLLPHVPEPWVTVEVDPPTETDRERARARLRALTDDPESRVRFTATTSLMRAGDAEALAAVDSLWADPDLTPNERAEVFLALPPGYNEEYAGIYTDVATNPMIPPEIRASAIQVLGDSDDLSVVEVLDQIAEGDPLHELRVDAAMAANAVRERLTEDTGPEDAETPETPAPNAGAE